MKPKQKKYLYKIGDKVKKKNDSRIYTIDHTGVDFFDLSDTPKKQFITFKEIPGIFTSKELCLVRKGTKIERKRIIKENEDKPPPTNF